MISDFLSFGLVVNNPRVFDYEEVANLNSALKKHVKDYELLILINSSQDEDFDNVRSLIKDDKFENILIFSTYTQLNRVAAEWCILSNSIGEKVILLNENIKKMENTVNQIVSSTLSAITLYKNNSNPKKSFSYRLFRLFFRKLASSVFGKDIESYEYPVISISRNIINELSNASNPPSALQKEIILNSQKSSVKNIDINLKSKKN